jgi:two-component sensor histidine kinase
MQKTGETMPLQRRLYILVLLAVLPSLAVQTYGSIQAYNQRKAEVQAETIRLAEFVSGELDRIIDNVRAALVALSKFPAARTSDAAACTTYVKDLATQYKALTGFGVIDRSGRLVCSSLPLNSRPTDFSSWDPFKEAQRTHEFTLSAFTVGKVSGRQVIAAVLPLYSTEGQFDGVVSTSIDLDWLNHYFADKSLPAAGAIGVTDRNGIIVVRVPVLPSAIGAPINAESRWMLTAKKPGTFDVTGRDGVERIVGFLPLEAPPRDLLVSVGVGKQEAMAGVTWAAIRDTLLFILTLLLALAAAFFGGHRFIRNPVDRLIGAAQRWSAGDLQARAALPESRSEIGKLGAAFDKMAADLEKREQDMQTALHEKTILIEELNHRVKNMLAAVQSVAHQSLSNAGTASEGIVAFQSRLMGMSAAYDVLTQRSWTHADLHDLASQLLGPYGGPDGRRIAISGPRVSLSPPQALPMAMALHEMCTNATKYGALSKNGGRVDLRWSVSDVDSQKRLHLHWKESGGPAVQAPNRLGFGTRLIERSLVQALSAKVCFNFSPSGFVCEIDGVLVKASSEEAQPLNRWAR